MTHHSSSLLSQLPSPSSSRFQLGSSNIGIQGCTWDWPQNQAQSAKKGDRTGGHMHEDSLASNPRPPLHHIACSAAILLTSGTPLFGHRPPPTSIFKRLAWPFSPAPAQLRGSPFFCSNFLSRTDLEADQPWQRSAKVSIFPAQLPPLEPVQGANHRVQFREGGRRMHLRRCPHPPQVVQVLGRR